MVDLSIFDVFGVSRQGGLAGLSQRWQARKHPRCLRLPEEFQSLKFSAGCPDIPIDDGTGRIRFTSSM